MLSRGVLLAVRLVVGFMATPRLLEALATFGGLSIFAYRVLALLAGLVVWLVGLALSQVLPTRASPRAPPGWRQSWSPWPAHSSSPSAARSPWSCPAPRALLSDDLYPLLGAGLG
jgi:hypothetical protein